MISHQQKAHLQDFILTHAIRLIEEKEGPLVDKNAVYQAHKNYSGDQERLLERGRLLSNEQGCREELERWRQIAHFGFFVFIVLAYLISGGMVVALAQPDRTINAALALMSVLALPSFIFFAWIYSAIQSFFGKSDQSNFSIGLLLLNLIARFPYGRHKRSLYLLAAVQHTMQRHGIGVWMFGYFSHMLWAVTYILVLIRLKILFSFQSYRLVWETTDLSLQSFNTFLQITGWLPSQIGFQIPNNLTLNGTPSPEQIGAAASWLIGGALVYGLLPRAAAFFASGFMLKLRLGSTLQLDKTDTYFAKVLARLNALALSEKSDLEHPQPLTRPPKGHADVGMPRVGLALVGFELANGQTWPPVGFVADTRICKSISGTIDEIDEIHRQFEASQPEFSIVGLDLAASPDRGTDRFLRDLLPSTSNLAILMVPSNRHTGANLQRWQKWRKENFDGVVFLENVAEAQKWLQSINDRSN